MSRTINSPGVQITETDLSQYVTSPVATTVFVPGFAKQGPTDEVINTTSLTEFESIYGEPTTPAERYFYYTCKEVIQSGATVLTTRMPYGSGSGTGFTNQYSALIYPAITNGDSFVLSGTPIIKSLTEDEYNNFQLEQITWNTITSGSTTASYASGSGGVTVAGGLVVLNTAKTTSNELLESYYLTITDNSDIGPETDYTAVSNMFGLSADSAYYRVTTQNLTFTLSSAKDSAGGESVSELIENSPRYFIQDSYYDDSIIIGFFKVRRSLYEPQKLSISPVEIHTGSLDPNKLTTSPAGTQTFSLKDIINNNSNNIKVFVNPQIENNNWANGTIKKVRSANYDLRALGNYVPTFTTTDKSTGDLPAKLSRALSLVDSTENVDIDIVVDGGLSTIVTYGTGRYDDTTKKSMSINTVDEAAWKTIFDIYNNFAQVIRKDCVFISDPLRQIFIKGDNVKTLSLRSSSFTTHIYTALKNLYSGVNTNYSAAYANWGRIFDTFSSRKVWVPLSGFIAAAYATTDANTKPWYAPAGLTRGKLNNLIDLAVNPNQKQRDNLYIIATNPVVYFPEDGHVIFGQKTLQNKPTAFDRVNVRRLFLALERAVKKQLKYYVFEPNTQFTRTRLINSITPIFELAKNTQGVYDYLIVCDERNNTPDTIDRNELNVDIYIKPVKAAEFILVNFIATRTGQDFQELL